MYHFQKKVGMELAAITEGILCSHLAGVQGFSDAGNPRTNPVENWPAAVSRVTCRGQPQSTKPRRARPARLPSGLEP